MAEKLLKQVKLNKQGMNGLRIVGIQVYGEKAYRDKKGFNKKSPYYDTSCFFLKDYKGHKSHERVTCPRLMKKGEIDKEIKKIKRNEWILSPSGQKFAKEQTMRQRQLVKNS